VILDERAERSPFFLFGDKDDSNSRYLVIVLEMSSIQQRIGLMGLFETGRNEIVGSSGKQAL
jgi:hypothetical protein